MSYNWERELRDQEQALEAENLKRAEARLQLYKDQKKKIRCDSCNKSFAPDKIIVAESTGWISYGFYCSECCKN